MSNQYNDRIIEDAQEYVRRKMDENDTIPEEAFSTLVNEEIASRMEMTIEEDMDDEDDLPFESPTADELAQNEESYDN